MDGDFPGLKFDLFSVAREIVGALSIHLDRREGGRRLHDGADETRKHRCDRLWRRAILRRSRHLPVGIVAVSLNSPAHGEAIGLFAILNEWDGFRRLSKGNRQYARCQRVERAGVACLFSR